MYNGVFLIGQLALWAIIAVMVYRDCKNRGLDKDANTWAILTFLLGIFGVAGYWYFIIRPNKRGPGNSADASQ